jgi:hypothetical protein
MLADTLEEGQEFQKSYASVHYENLSEIHCFHQGSEENVLKMVANEVSLSSKKSIDMLPRERRKVINAFKVRLLSLFSSY